MKKIKVILDTDPGVDDSTGLLYAFFEPKFDIKLICACFGNVPVAIASRNICHLLDISGKDFPVVKGYEKRLGGSTEDATFLHMKDGMGGYKPPKTTTHTPLNEDCIDAIYKVLIENPHEVVFCILGPHTTFANLLIKHPDAKDLVKEVLMMGGAPMGLKSNPNHCSFNIRTDIPAFAKTLESGVKITMIPSNIGRDWGYFTEEQVEMLKNVNTAGRFMAKTYETYWEPNYEDKRIATNDVSALYYLVCPRLYKTKRADIELDMQTGRTTGNFHKKGKVNVAVSLKRDKFMKMMFKKLENIVLEVPSLSTQKKAKAPKWSAENELEIEEEIVQQKTTKAKRKTTDGREATSGKKTTSGNNESNAKKTTRNKNESDTKKIASRKTTKK